MKLLVKEPFVRVFVARADTAPLLERLLTAFDGRIDFQFDHAPSESTVYAVTCRIGRFSVTSTDREQPDFIAKTRGVYIVESIDDVLADARKHGIAIGQDKTRVPIGFQARLEIADGNFLELAEWTDEHIAELRADGFSFAGGEG